MPTKLLQLIPLSKNSVIFILITANVIAIAYIFISRDSVKKARLMYENPAVIERIKIQRVEGPVRIVERVIERPGGEKVTERTVTQAPVVITTQKDSESKPVVPMNQEKYLLGASWRTSFVHAKNVTIWAGYSFGRLDLMAGFGVEQQSDPSGHLMVVTRWGS